MQAMMSDACDGTEYRRYPEDATMALGEARRVLAVAEPGRVRYASQLALADGAYRAKHDAAQSCMAEALAAFCAADDVVAFLLARA